MTIGLSIPTEEALSRNWELIQTMQRPDNIEKLLEQTLGKELKQITPEDIKFLRKFKGKPMKVKFIKTNLHAISPEIANPGDAGADLTAVGMNDYKNYVQYETNIAVEIPEGYAGFLMARSSISDKDLILANGSGLIDSKFRGTIKARFKKTKENGNFYKPGDRIAQLVIVPYLQVEYEQVEELDETERGQGGFGSSDPTT